MKFLKMFFVSIFFSTLIASCTPQTLHDSESLDNHQATGDDGSYVEDGSKD